MEFEFDPAKSDANRLKHGLDFVGAQDLWLVPGAQKRLSFPDEDRYLRIAMLGEKYWSAVFTLRGSRVRIISVRRARAEEEVDYERAKAKEALDYPQP
jgi:uncharacterized protein